MSERGRAVVEALLAEELASWSPGAPDISLLGDVTGVEDGPVDASAADDRDDPYAGGRLAALEALGMLSPSERGAWQRRLSLVERGWRLGPRRGDEQRAAAVDHLDRQLERLAGAGPDDRMTVFDQIRGALVLLVCGGVVSEEELPLWSQRIDRLSETAQEDPGEVSDLGLDLAMDTRAVYRTHPLARHDGLCVTSVATHAAGLTINWHLVWEGELPIEPVRGFLDFSLADDLGTEYDDATVGGFGYSERDGPFAVIGESRCGQTVPAGASELRISSGAGTWVVPLDL